MAEAVCLFLAAVSLIWLGLLVYNLVNLRLTPRLAKPAVPPSPGDDPPLVSILVPARNEASRILRESIRSMCGQRHPAVEVIAVNDNSTDETLATVHELAAELPRLRVIDGTPPPEGWVGKVHALHQAAAAAQGQWLLGTDADIVLDPDAVGAALAAAAEQQTVMVTLIPGSDRDRPMMNCLLPVAGWMILVVFPPRATNNPRDRRALGCGGFLMIRRDAFEAVGGYTAVAGEVVDDVGMAAALKAKGYPLLCALAPELVYTPMYRTVGELWLGFGKNALHGCENRISQALQAIALQVGGAVVPPLTALGLTVALALGADPAWQPACLAAWACWLALAAAFVPVYRSVRLSGWYALATPWPFALMSGVLASAIWRRLAGRAIDWRGRPVSGSPSRR